MAPGHCHTPYSDAMSKFSLPIIQFDQWWRRLARSNGMIHVGKGQMGMKKWAAGWLGATLGPILQNIFCKTQDCLR